jgi:hypothetical protein
VSVADFSDYLQYIIKKIIPTQKKKRLQHIYRQLSGTEAPDDETARDVSFRKTCSSAKSVMTLEK